MAIHIEHLQIEQFRGIQQLSIPSLNHVNLIVGDNNCGKTSFLEAVSLLRSPGDFTNTLRISHMRDNLNLLGRITPYESLLALFPYIEVEMKRIEINAHCHKQDILYLLQGTLQNILLDPEELKTFSRFLIRKENISPLECHAFHGELLVRTANIQEKKDILFHEYSNISGREISKDQLLNIVYLAPFDHLRGSLFSSIIKNVPYKDLCIGILQLFDPGITDLLLLKNEITNRPIECVKHKKLGITPLSTYGDGIKKVLSIASGIAKAVDGVLMIDEVETAIHSRYFDEIFRFITSACRKFNVQVFITSHSIEAIDSFLAIEDYDQKSYAEDPISVVTLKKDTDSFRSYARVLSGRHVYQNREQFGFEVRL